MNQEGLMISISIKTNPSITNKKDTGCLINAVNDLFIFSFEQFKCMAVFQIF